jgi:hypothetical protein
VVLRLSFSCSSKTERRLVTSANMKGCTLLSKWLIFFFFLYFWRFKFISYKNGSWSFAVSVHLCCQSVCSNSEKVDFFI